MDTESFFTKLRRLGTTVESETARLEENMKKPIGLRSSGSGRSSRSSNLILKEMQHEAKNVKRQAKETLKTAKSENQQFQDIVKAVQALTLAQKTELQQIQSYLKQYGYQPCDEQVDQKGADKSKKVKQNKENHPPCEDSIGSTSENGKTDNAEEKKEEIITDNEENNFKTPTKTPSDNEDKVAAGNRTPQLADFGLSQFTMDRLQMIKMPQSSVHRGVAPPGMMQATPVVSDRTYNISAAAAAALVSTSNPSKAQSYISSHHHLDIKTPQCQHPMPFSQDTVKVTPGLFGNRPMPSDTPDHFIDKGLPGLFDSPVPPVLTTVKKWPNKSSCMAPPMMQSFDGHDDGAASPALPQPPYMTVAWSEIIPSASHQLHDNLSTTSTILSDVTPPMPIFLSTQTAITTSMPPAPPTRLATKYESAPLPQEPVQLATLHPTQKAEMPSRPVLLAETLGVKCSMPVEPVQLTSLLQGEVGTPEPPVLLTQRFGAKHYIPASSLSQSQEVEGHQEVKDIDPSSMEAIMYATPQQHVLGVRPSTAWQSQKKTVVANSMTATPVLPQGVTPKRPAALSRLQDEEDEMPKTPELTMSYKRYVDINPPSALTINNTSANLSTDVSQPIPPSTPVMQVAPYQAEQRASMFCQIAPITEQEFCGVQDYLQRILPLHIINGHIDTLNQVLRNKQDSSYITEEETTVLNLGAQLKVMTLLMCKFKRWKQGTLTGTNKTVMHLL